MKHTILLVCSLLANPVNRLGTVKLLSCLGGSRTRNLRKTAGVAGASGGLIFDDRAIGTDGLCAAVHFHAHSDVELRQWQGCELYPICKDGVRHQPGRRTSSTTRRRRRMAQATSQ